MNDMIKEYEAGASAYALSVEHGMEMRTVYRRLHAAGVKVRSKGHILILTADVLDRAIAARGDFKAMQALAEEVGLTQRYLRRKATEAYYERHSIDRRGT